MRGTNGRRRPNKPVTPFGKLVLKALVDREMTRAQLAGAVGVSPQYLSYILTGTRSGTKYIPAIIAALEPGPTQGGEGHRSLTAEGRDRGAGGIYSAQRSSSV